MNINPLTAPIARILHDSPRGISEYQLLSQLDFADLQLHQQEQVSADLLLFRKHFLVMNALYRLQPVMWEQGYYLTISALNIALHPVSATSPATLPGTACDQKLRDYYLDWHQFEQSSHASVERLLDSFWQHYFAEDKKAEALALLQLEAGCSQADIRAAWRRLAALHHPDRGGDSEQFRRVREAYELIACCYV